MFADTNRCDLDKDLAADVCDDDIDGDGVKNIIGIEQYDLSDCSFSEKKILIEIFYWINYKLKNELHVW